MGAVTSASDQRARPERPPRPGRRPATRRLVALALAGGLVAGACASDDDGPAPAEPTARLEEAWTTQLGSDESDTTFGVDVLPTGDAVVVASTQGTIAEPHQGGRDVFVARLDETGEVVWSTQLGAEGDDSPLGVSVGPAGEVYVAGFTESSLAGPNAGSADAWIARFDDKGELVWQDQFGGDDWDRVFDVSAFDAGAYVTGYTLGQVADDPAPGDGDGFVARYDDQGNREWTIQFGTPETDWAQGSAVAPDGGLYVTGYTAGNLASPSAGQRDAFLAHVDPTGTVSWTAQLGSDGDDWTQGVGTDGDGNAYIAGTTSGTLGDRSFGGTDGLLAAFSPEGEQLFATQIGSAGTDKLFEVRLDGDTIYATAASDGDIPESDQPGAGGQDGYLMRFNRDGSTIDATAVATPESDDLTGLAITSNGAVVASGYTSGDLGSPNEGSSDLFVTNVESFGP